MNYSDSYIYIDSEIYVSDLTWPEVKNILMTIRVEFTTEGGDDPVSNKSKLKFYWFYVYKGKNL